MSSLFELVEKRSEHEALKAAILHHGQHVVGCGCWHDDAYAARRLHELLGHMQALTERLVATLDGIQAIEGRVFSARQG